MTVLPTVRRQIELAAQQAAAHPARSRGHIRLPAGSVLAAGSVIVTLAVVAAAIVLVGHTHHQAIKRPPAITAPNRYPLGLTASAASGSASRRRGWRMVLLNCSGHPQAEC